MAFEQAGATHVARDGVRTLFAKPAIWRTQVQLPIVQLPILAFGSRMTVEQRQRPSPIMLPVSACLLFRHSRLT
jgi:hypothetical protein